MLEEMARAEGSLLDNEVIVNDLYQVRTSQAAIEKRIQSSKEMEARCDDTREQYRTIASRGSMLYDILREISVINPMYQCGFSQYVTLFKSTLLKSPGSNKLMNRINNILKEMNQAIFNHMAGGK